MPSKRFIVIGAGELGFHLARSLQEDEYGVVLIDIDGERRRRIEDELDLQFITGSGTELEVLKKAGVEDADLFIAASNSEESNLVASILAKHLGARRTAVRLETTEELTTFRSLYEGLFRADLLFSPLILATTQVLNRVLGHNTREIDFLAQGRIQLRTIEVQPDCPMTQQSLEAVKLPAESLIIGCFDDRQELLSPASDQPLEQGSKALVLCTVDNIRQVEKLFSSTLSNPRSVVIAGAGKLGIAVAEALLQEVPQVKILERDRKRAREAGQRLPGAEVLHADATDALTLRAEGIDRADAFVATTGHDESNLMAALIAREIGVRNVLALVNRTETNLLWKRAQDIETISPRYLAAQRIAQYIGNGYRANMVSLQDGALRVFHKRIFEASPVCGATLAEIGAPAGILVGAIVRAERVFVPKANDRLLNGDLAILFVHRSQDVTLGLLFPGEEEDG